jgi:AcrR family transcriptional regulator
MSSQAARPGSKRRNKGYTGTHQQMIETAVRLISEKGADALSIAGLAREMAINRTTVYYHFDSREALLGEVRHWSSEQLARAFNLAAPQRERIDYLTRFVLENPELIKLWIEELVSGEDIRESYPLWDDLVAGIRSLAEHNGAMVGVDAEVFCVNLLVSAIIGPRVFRDSVRPEEDIDTVTDRFHAEWARVLRLESLYQDG